jgi:hypothetical protein
MDGIVNIEMITKVEHLTNPMGQTGSVIVWNKVFEAGNNREMAERYPSYRKMLENINDRIFDLMEIFSKGYFIHPDFYGSASIKNVLPILVEDRDLSYEELSISKADDAMLTWYAIMAGEFPPRIFHKSGRIYSSTANSTPWPC